jgi:hypothetical protein
VKRFAMWALFVWCCIGALISFLSFGTYVLQEKAGMAALELGIMFFNLFSASYMHFMLKDLKP